MMKRLSNQLGFTLIDLILSISIMLLMGAFIAEFMGTQTKTLMNVANRQEAMGDARFALNRISYELMRVDPATEITAFTGTTVYFRDDTGVNTSFRMDTIIGGGLGLYRGTTLLLGYIDSFTITYYNSAGAVLNPATATANQIVRMRVKIVTADDEGEGKRALQTAVTPRSVIGYENFQ